MVSKLLRNVQLWCLGLFSQLFSCSLPSNLVKNGKLRMESILLTELLNVLRYSYLEILLVRKEKESSHSILTLFWLFIYARH